jgi:hypothetical protein
MAAKSRFIGVRIEPEQQRKLILLSVKAGQPGNMSAGLRWALDQVSEAVVVEVSEPTQQKSEAMAYD